MYRIYKLSLMIKIILLLILMPTPESVYAQWPPFRFRLIPSYESGKITYNVDFLKRVDWTMTNVTIKIPLPEGTRFVESNTIPTIETSFDGAEITFFVPVLNRRIRRGDAFFVVEVTDPATTVLTAHAWIAWEGDRPGDYLTNDINYDITRQPLAWEAPARSRLQLEASATVADEVVTYFIYPKNVGGRRMWDVKINIPLPEGTTFLSAEAPPSFVSSFDGKEVSFSTIELERRAEVGPLSFKVSTKEVTAPFIVTHAWATWKNSDRRVGRSIVLQEEIRTGDIIVQPDTVQWVFSDVLGDVPFSDYDVTSITFEDYTIAFKLAFYTAEELRPVGEPVNFRLYIDNDCNVETGRRQNGIGADYRVIYNHKWGRFGIDFWDKDEKTWKSTGRTEMASSVTKNMVAVWVPYDLLDLADHRSFCWVAEVKNGTTAFNPYPPYEYVIPKQPNLKLIPSGATPPIIITNPSEGTFIKVGDVWQYLPGWSEPDPDWKDIDFDDSNWFSGPTSIGYGDRKHATDLSLITRAIQNDTTPILVQRTITETGVVLATLPSGADDVSVFARRAFTVTHPLTQLMLEIDYEDGFVAYLNGAEVARRGLESISPIVYDTIATNHPAGTPEVIDLSDHIIKLVTRTNVLAVQVHRSADASLNLFVAPELTWQNNPGEIILGDDVDNILLGEANASASTQPIAPSFTDIGGKLAVPIDNGRIAYDVHIFSIPDGQELVKIPNARQPNFRFDGQRLLINREGGGVENVFEYNLIDGTEQQVSDAPQDWHPFYDPWGNRVVYGNAELTVGSPEPLRDKNGNVVRDPEDDEIIHYSPKKPFIFVQCGLQPPHLETDPRCRNIPWLGVLVPAGQMGEIQGTHPVWTANDMIAYKGCNSWAGFSSCGIYIVPSSSTKGFSDGFIPRQLTRETSDIPTDTRDNLIAFMSQRDGDWEAYIMDLNGDGVKNLSNSPNSNDGLPTISPDGNWVAFISDRGGRWAVWVVPVVGGSAQKLFDLPAGIPWGDGDRAWTNERISWGL